MIKIKQLIWDDWNVKHIGKHKITVDEVGEVCRFVKKVLKTYQGRLVVLGKTKKDRSLTVVLAPKGKNKYYVVTARDTSKKERRILK